MAREQINYPIGECLPGTKYRVVRKLGQGGMGVVFEVGKDPGLRAVVKIIHPALAARPDFRRRFFDEVRILAKLEHPNIVRVMDYDQLADGTPYIVMEYLQGNTVQSALRSAQSVQPVNLYLIMRGLMEGLEYAHGHEPPIVHRDVKAENIFIHAPAFGEPCVKLIDFGVAGGDSIVEEHGVFVGTTQFAAPEQLRGHRATPKADLYSAALVLYEGLARRGPFDDVPLIPADGGDRGKAFIRAHLSLPPPSVRTFAPWVPPEIDALLQSALAKDPSARPASAYSFAAQLYMLQFTSASPISPNTTAPTLVTMVTQAPSSAGSGRLLAAGSERTPRGDAAPTRELGKPQKVNDTWVDPPRLQASLVRDTPANGTGHGPEVYHSKEASPPALRSFAAAEAARNQENLRVATRRTRDAPPVAHSPTPAWVDDGVSRSIADRSRAAVANHRPALFLAVGLGIPVIAVALLVGIEVSRSPSVVVGASGVAAHVVPTAVVPLPPEAPPSVVPPPPEARATPAAAEAAEAPSEAPLPSSNSFVPAIPPAQPARTHSRSAPARPAAQQPPNGPDIDRSAPLDHPEHTL
jgi:serine/threonine protein kinase